MEGLELQPQPLLKASTTATPASAQIPGAVIRLATGLKQWRPGNSIMTTHQEDSLVNE
jgi:hypothetical protein